MTKPGFLPQGGGQLGNVLMNVATESFLPSTGHLDLVFISEATTCFPGKAVRSLETGNIHKEHPNGKEVGLSKEPKCVGVMASSKCSDCLITYTEIV